MNKKLWWLLLALMLSGCGSVRTEQLQNVMREYDRAMRWSDFQTAYALTNQPAASAPDFQRLQSIRITGYDERGSGAANPEGTKLIRAVQIGYVNVNRMSDRSIMDQQVWEFAESDKRWKLVSPFPSFY
jgi:hypothetical protein